VLLIVNPWASSMNARRRLGVERAFFRRHRLEVAETEHRGHATELARTAADDGFDVVVVAGGDGTLNEAANGLVGSATALAPLPGGSTNVFVRSLGYTNRLRPALDEVLDALEEAHTRRVGLGNANGRRFLFNLGVGYDAAVIARMEQRRQWVKRRLAHPAFAWTAVGTFFGEFDRHEPAFRVELPRAEAPAADAITRDDLLADEPPEDEPLEGYFAIVSNAAPYAFFGPRPMRVSSAASLERMLALTMFRRLTAGALVPAVVESMARGVRRHRSILQCSDLERLSIVAIGPPFAWQVDGDYLGELERLDVRYEPDDLSLVVPTTA
jgi:diacylglycerol kinase family enzyme